MNENNEAEGAVSNEKTVERSGLISFEEVKGGEVFLGEGCEKAQSNPLSFSSREGATSFGGIFYSNIWEKTSRDKGR